jgi:hypothetical protein
VRIHPDIIGYTLAEISLVLVFSLMAERTHAVNKVNALTTQLRNANLTVIDLQKKIVNSTPRPQTPSPHQGKRSNAPPSCAEDGLSTDWLFTGSIVGSDRYRVNGEELSFQEITDRFRKQIAEGRDRACVQRVQVSFSPALSSPDYDRAIRQLEKLFYVKKLGPEG